MVDDVETAVPARQQRGGQFAEIGEQRGYVELGGAEHAAAGESQHVAGQAVDVIDAAAQLADAAPPGVVTERGVFEL